ncbi:acyl-CoA thioesterase II [uncultured Demequina sp.]|uniref:acyl-CoA thioesterase n=1 Tax=uncultured Demequina sp. TaxID=693499 RepID=UPI0025EA253B|nr:acyl-CoA thioesterase domain-containing protein [uncultured Demequina sp.]
MDHVEDIWAEQSVASGLAVLTLRRLGDDTFEGDSLPMPNGRAYGGQVLAQALLAAGATIPEDRHVHSLHGYFLRPGDAGRPIRFEVEELRDGRSFSARRTHAIQDEKPILSMVTSFQLDQDGPEHSVTMPEVPGPEDVVSAIDHMAPLKGHPTADYWLERTPFDVRHVEGAVFTQPDPRPKQYQTAWMRTRTPIEGSDLLHRALLAFGCDSMMLEPLLRQHGLAWRSPGFSYASLDHAMWWHRPARADEWLLYVQDAPTAQGGRGLGGAWIFSEDGRLVASAAQEGMFRLSR